MRLGRRNFLIQMVLLMDVLALGSFIVLELLQVHNFSCKLRLICKITSLGSFSFYHFLIFFRNSRAIIYLIGPGADGAFWILALVVGRRNLIFSCQLPS